MTTLKIPEVILRERRKKNITQEELASALDVTPQAISNWERGGYPDITLLPRIANYFGITVDELIGNDAVTLEEDIETLQKHYAFNSTKEGCAERIALAKKYYEKYPQNDEVMWYLGMAITGNHDEIEKNRPLLREIYEKILSGSTYEPYRKDAADWMCYAAEDDELDNWIPKTGRDWGADATSIGMLREDRFRIQERWDEFRRQRSMNDLLFLMQYLGRSNMEYYDHDEDRYHELFGEPEHTAAWEAHKIRLLANLEDTLPDAWLGCYAESHLKLAGALIGSGQVDEGFSKLDETFALYEKWNAIPDKTMLSFGTGLYHDAKIAKNSGNTTVYYEDGTSSWTPYMWLFWQLKNDIEVALTKWHWFEGVKDDPRYLSALDRAKTMAGTK